MTPATRLRELDLHDDANASMRALNAALGFRPVETLLYLHRARPERPDPRA